VIIGIFVLSWIASTAYYRARGLDKLGDQEAVGPQRLSLD
jgi:hypothetical protein